MGSRDKPQNVAKHYPKAVDVHEGSAAVALEELGGVYLVLLFLSPLLWQWLPQVDSPGLSTLLEVDDASPSGLGDEDVVALDVVVDDARLVELAHLPHDVRNG